MKKNIITGCFLFVLFFYSANAQNDIQAGIFTLLSDSTMLQVKAIPSSTITNEVFSGVNFTIRWLSSYNISLNTPSSTFLIAKNDSEQTSGIYKYQIFSGTPNQNVTWVANVPITLMTIKINQTGDGQGNFELAPADFLAGSGEEWFIEIGGVERTNPTFNPGSTVGLLPVELISFTASANSNIVNLNWETATEVNNYGFDVERHVSNKQLAISSWEKIGFVQGHGNSNSPKSYSFTDKSLTGGSKFKYRLKQIDINGQYEYSNEVEVEIAAAQFVLEQNYPNPFNPTTNIKFELPQAAKATLIIYNILGQQVANLLNENLEAGFHSVTFNAADLPSGTYVYRLQAGSFVQTKKMILLK